MHMYVTSAIIDNAIGGKIFVPFCNWEIGYQLTILSGFAEGSENPYFVNWKIVLVSSNEQNGASL